MLELSSKFKQALGNGVRTSLYPLVKIYKGYQIDDDIPDNAESVNLSIKETTIKNLDDSYASYLPLLLNSPSISSKADIINNKYTISSVSLSISNAPYNGKIFSDDIPSLLNAVVEVYYAANGIDNLEDCLLVYTGTIRRYSQSAETLNLTLEDLTEQKLKTQIPTTLVDDSDTFGDDQLGKPYPMVYGYVDKSPLILDRFDNLVIDKPNTEVEGVWENISNISHKNEHIKQGHYLVDNGYLKTKSFLFSGEEKYLPIIQEMPKKFGSRDYGLDETNIYEFENSTVNTSAKITINSNNLIYSEYTLVDIVNDDGTTTQSLEGSGDLGVPTRVYRPVTNISFRASNMEAETILIYQGSGEYKAFMYPASNCKFYGFSNNQNYGMAKEVNHYKTESGVSQDFNNTIDNFVSNADELYLDAFESGAWWEPTLLNSLSGTDNPEVFDDKDTNYPLENQKFPVEWIQNGDHFSGLLIDAQARVNFFGGGFARLQLDTDIDDLPCVSKIFYMIDYFTPTNIDTQDSGQQYDIVQCEPTAFWKERNLVTRNVNINQEYSDMTTIKNRWEINYDPERGDDWGTACEVPNVNHEFDDSNINEDFRITNMDGHPNGDGINSMIQGFSSTKSYDSIQWGLPDCSSGTGLATIHSCIANLKEFYFIQDVLLTEYTKKNYYANIKGRIDDNETLITKPKDVLKNILTEELKYNKDILSTDFADDWMYSFTINEQKEAKNVIEDLFKSSTQIPSFDSKGQFKIVNILQNIEDYEEFDIIKNSDIINYSFGLTKLEDVKNQVNVKYKKDYASGDFSEETGFGIENNSGVSLNTLDEVTQQITPNMVYDVGFYGMIDEDAKLEVESEYIRDRETAKKLQRRLLMWYANQHLTAKIDLPPSYMHLEAGDYLRFDELIGSKLAFGFDYTQEFVKNGQLIYPVFFVSKVSKSLSKVTIELVQVHRGNFGMDDSVLGSYEIFDPYYLPIYQDVDQEGNYFYGSWYQDNGDLGTGLITAITNTNLQTGIEIVGLKIFNCTGSEIEYNGITINNGFQDTSAFDLVNATILETNSEYGDNVQITPKMNHSNITFLDEDNYVTLIYELKVKSSNSVDVYVLNFFQTITPPNYQLGDISRDGGLNILDIVLLANIILNNSEYDNLADLNNDGINNVSDIVILVNQILGE